MASYNRDETNRLLQEEVPTDYIAERAGPGRTKVAYIEGHRVIETANEVFSFDGWSSQILQMSEDFFDHDGSSYQIGIYVIVRVIHRSGAFHEDTGYGSAKGANKADVIEKARKEAVTDGLKRALRLFGNRLGNSVYNKEKTEQSKRQRLDMQANYIVQPAQQHRIGGNHAGNALPQAPLPRKTPTPGPPPTHEQTQAQTGFQQPYKAPETVQMQPNTHPQIDQRPPPQNDLESAAVPPQSAVNYRHQAQISHHVVAGQNPNPYQPSPQVQMDQSQHSAQSAQHTSGPIPSQSMMNGNPPAVGGTMTSAEQQPPSVQPAGMTYHEQNSGKLETMTDETPAQQPRQPTPAPAPMSSHRIYPAPSATSVTTSTSSESSMIPDFHPTKTMGTPAIVPAHIDTKSGAAAQTASAQHYDPSMAAINSTKSAFAPDQTPTRAAASTPALTTTQDITAIPSASPPSSASRGTSQLSTATQPSASTMGKSLYGKRISTPTTAGSPTAGMQTLSDPQS